MLSRPSACQKYFWQERGFEELIAMRKNVKPLPVRCRATIHIGQLKAPSVVPKLPCKAAQQAFSQRICLTNLHDALRRENRAAGKTGGSAPGQAAFRQGKAAL